MRSGGGELELSRVRMSLRFLLYIWRLAVRYYDIYRGYSYVIHVQWSLMNSLGELSPPWGNFPT